MRYLETSIVRVLETVMAFRDEDQLISAFSYRERKKPAPKKGWRYSISGLPDIDVAKVWGHPIRELHHLKANTTDYFLGDEHVATVRWRVYEHILCMKKPPAGYVRPRRDRRDLEAEIAAYRARLDAERPSSSVG